MEFIGPLQKDRFDRINDVAVKGRNRVVAAIHKEMDGRARRLERMGTQ